MGLIAGGLTVSAVGGMGIYTQVKSDPVPVTVTAGKSPVVAVDVPKSTWYAWQWVNLTTGERYGSANAATEATNTESMIKPWIGADYLTRLAKTGRKLSAADKALISTMIRLSDNTAAQTLWRRGGGDAVIQRAIDECGLSRTSVFRDWWSKTQITAADATTMMSHILDLAKTSPSVAWMVDELMRSVDPSNAFGIAEVLAQADPGVRPAIKNGWTAHTAAGRWNLNCLAQWQPTGSDDHILLAILTRYPVANGQAYGEKLARDLTRQLIDQLLPGTGPLSGTL
jgi:hypothetical protein